MDNAPIRLLKDCATIYLGFPFRGAVKAAPAGDTWVIQPRDIDDDYAITWNSNELTKTELPGKKAPNYLQNGDVLFLARGNKNYASTVITPFENTVCSPIFFQLRIKDGASLLPEFLAWQINQAPVQKQLLRTTEGSAQKNVSRASLENIQIMIPPIETQNKTLRLARCFEKEIKLHQQLIENTKLAMTAIANDILTGARK